MSAVFLTSDQSLYEMDRYSITIIKIRAGQSLAEKKNLF